MLTRLFFPLIFPLSVFSPPFHILSLGGNQNHPFGDRVGSGFETAKLEINNNKLKKGGKKKGSKFFFKQQALLPSSAAPGSSAGHVQLVNMKLVPWPGCGDEYVRANACEDGGVGCRERGGPIWEPAQQNKCVDAIVGSGRATAE